MRAFTSVLLCMGLSTMATAQQNANTILILDGSGSMWGQVEGTAKITIAQEVIADLLKDFPSNQTLGLTAYGHRTEGSCTDIETIVVPATGTASAIRDAVNAVTPRGKTPMTDAIIAAADALAYTDHPATVVLVSDGVETCHPDPCAATRVLEETGAAFTAHVIGFDVNDPEALAQMQCIAEETGGKFLTASNAQELSLAMTAMVTEDEPVPPAPLPTATLTAPDTATAGASVPVAWTGPDGEGDSLVVTTPGDKGFLNFTYTSDGSPLDLLMPSEPGEYEIRYLHSPRGDAVLATAPITVLAAIAQVTAPPSAPVGATLELPWSGPAYEGDYLAVGPVGDSTYDHYVYLYEGNPAPLLMPTTPGEYEVRYHLGQGDEVVFRTPITIDAVTAEVTAPASAPAGSTLELPWSGPGYEADYLAVGPIGESTYNNYVYLYEGNPAPLLLPSTPGEYEIRYHLGQGDEILFAAPITVAPVTARLDAEAVATIGKPFNVTWEGPGYTYDFIAIGLPGDDGYLPSAYAYVNEGQTIMVPLPDSPGDYVLHYFLGQGEISIASQPLTVTE